MAPHSVGFRQIVRQVLVRWMASSGPDDDESWTASAAGRMSWRLTSGMPSDWQRRVVIRVHAPGGGTVPYTDQG